MSKNILFLCLLPVLLGACFWPQGTESGNGGSAAADAALKSLADDPGNFLAQSFALLFSSPQTDKDGLFGRFPENYEDPEDGFTFWMPKNMNSRFGGGNDFMQRQIDACMNGGFLGGRYDKPDKDVYRQLDENTRLYAYYLSYYDTIYI